ncbi:class I SAM-dependent methyltransferase [Nocardia paucivorans]|uniref:class I SAM-dependent methyltransferase n=1 Tax=Nocardia paucivorans TaxID=114259 RepID=UPI00030ADE31|nr:class I SAM-dependent methyltransferase [Nocardia paucivorans]
MGQRTVEDAYAARSQEYIELFGSVDSVRPDDLALVRRWAELAGGRVLDIGCGPGHLTAYLHGLGVDITGIDPVREFVEHARARYPGPAFEVGSAQTPGLPDGSITGILAWYSLIHVPPAELDGILAGFRRMLVPGGVVLLGFFEGATVEEFPHKVVTAYRWPFDELARRLAVAGFRELERLTRTGGEHRPHGAILVRSV